MHVLSSVRMITCVSVISLAVCIPRSTLARSWRSKESTVAMWTRQMPHDTPRFNTMRALAHIPADACLCRYLHLRDTPPIATSMRSTLGPPFAPLPYYPSRPQSAAATILSCRLCHVGRLSFLFIYYFLLFTYLCFFLHCNCYR